MLGKLIEIEGLSELELLNLHADTLEELRRRGMVRSSNNPVGDKEDFSILCAAMVPRAVLAERASYAEVTKSWRLLLTDDIWNCDGVVDVTGEMISAAG